MRNNAENRIFRFTHHWNLSKNRLLLDWCFLDINRSFFALLRITSG